MRVLVALVDTQVRELLAGQRPTRLEVMGGVLACVGLVWLLAGDLQTPKELTAILMVLHSPR